MKHACLFLAFVVCPVLGVQAADPSLSGFVDASYAHNLGGERGEFGLDQAELDLTHAVSERTSARADFEWVKNGDEFELAVEQGFLAHQVSGWGFTLGRFNAPIGFEMLDAPDMYQYSHALVFTYALPTNLTGLMIGHDLPAGFSALAYAVNGWDRNAQSKRPATFGGRLGYERGLLSGGLSLIAGREESDDPALDRAVFDADLALRPEGWVLGAEVNTGGAGPATEESSNWFGFLLMAHHDFSARAGLTVRYDYLKDEDGYLFGMIHGEPQTRQAIAIAPNLVLDRGVGMLLEVRVDLSDQDTFLDADGAVQDTETAVALEATYAW